MIDNRAWIAKLIQSKFPPNVVGRILSIPISESKDSIMWCMNKGGKYIVSSGYKVAFEFFHPSLEQMPDRMKKKSI